MSRVGSMVLSVPTSVKVEQKPGLLVFKGPKGEQSVVVPPVLKVEHEGGLLSFKPLETGNAARRMWGTVASLTRNAIEGASQGFARRMILEGVGFRAAMRGQSLAMSLGLSHEVVMPVPQDLKAAIVSERPVIVEISGVSKQRVGQFCSELRSLRPPEPYKGKGVRYANEILLRKEGKKK